VLHSIEVGEGPSADPIERLTRCLFESGAKGVIATPAEGDLTFEDPLPVIFNLPKRAHHAAV